LGGWGASGWLIPWSDDEAAKARLEAPASATPKSPEEVAEQKAKDARVKAITSITRAGGGALGSLLGGWLASLLGRRTTYFLISLSSFAISQYIYRFLTPLDASFQYWVFTLGFISTVFFGWLPLYLPELFPTTARATGTGVAFNFGRIATAAGVLGAGELMSLYSGDYAKVGQITSLIYACGMLVILFAPDTTRKRLAEEK
jgi:MFS family permease